MNRAGIQMTFHKAMDWIVEGIRKIGGGRGKKIGGISWIDGKEKDYAYWIGHLLVVGLLVWFVVRTLI